MNFGESNDCHSGLWIVPSCLLLSLVLAGCGATRTPPPPQAQLEEPAEAAPADTPGPEAAGQANQAAEEQAEAAAPETPDPEPMVLEPVGPEDARRGKTIAGGGIITEPLRQNFLIQHRIVFEISLKQAEQLYKAEHGRMPRSHDEYMAEIVEKNQIALPELDPGWDYYYDADTEELKKCKVQ